jgi:hypothetical protein
LCSVSREYHKVQHFPSEKKRLFIFRPGMYRNYYYFGEEVCFIVL